MYLLAIYSLLGVLSFRKKVYDGIGAEARPFWELANLLEEILEKGLRESIRDRQGATLFRCITGKDKMDIVEPAFGELPRDLELLFPLELVIAAMETPFHQLDFGVFLHRLETKKPPTFCWRSDFPRWEESITVAARQHVERLLVRWGMCGMWDVNVEFDAHISLDPGIPHAMLFLRFDEAGLVWKDEEGDPYLDVP